MAASILFGQTIGSVQLEPRPDDPVDAADEQQRRALEPPVDRDQVHAVERSVDEARQTAFADITRWCEEEKLLHAVAARFPLDEIAAAHECVERGAALGNVVVDVA